MYPNTYFGLFPAFPRENKVFVAMSFDDKFKHRWENVIIPAIGAISRNGVPLVPHRVDTRIISDSILTEILGGIANDILILADISTIGYVDSTPIRNGNVMYELGVAQASRLPEEVLVFRSDSDRLLFDLSNVRVNRYDPDGGPSESKSQLANAMYVAITELDQRRQLSVKAAAHSLDFQAWNILSMALMNGRVQNFATKTVGQLIGSAASNMAIVRLLEIGALETDYATATIEMTTDDTNTAERLVRYRPTDFGRAVMQYVATKMMEGATPETQSALESWYQSEREKGGRDSRGSDNLM